MDRKDNYESNERPDGSMTQAEAIKLMLSQKTDFPLVERRRWQLSQPQYIGQVNHVLGIMCDKQAQAKRLELSDDIRDNACTWTGRAMFITRTTDQILDHLKIRPTSLIWGQQMMMETILEDLFDSACHVGIQLDELKQGPDWKL